MLNGEAERPIEHNKDISNLSLTDEEIKRVADLFAILIKVDQRIKNENKDK